MSLYEQVSVMITYGIGTISGPLMVDPYDVNRATGAFILVDEATNDTVAAGMVRTATA